MTSNVPLDEEEKFILWDKSCLGICRRWRDCILGIRHMWSTVTLEDSTSIEEATTWLSRASSSPLRVFASFNPTWDGERWELIWELVTSHPIKSYSLSSGRDFDFWGPYPLPQRMSLIEDLEAANHDDSDPDSSPLFEREQPNNLKSFAIMGFARANFFIDQLNSIDLGQAHVRYYSLIQSFLIF